MDNLWQRHRTFILKILAGLAVCLLAWIIGSSLSGKGMDTLIARNDSVRRSIRSMSVPSPKDTSAYRAAADELRKRILFVANRVAETRSGENLRTGLIKDLLVLVGQDSPATRDELIRQSRQNAQACVTRLQGMATTALRREAGPKNIVIDERLGFDGVEVASGEVDRYLLTLKLIVEAVRMGIDEGVSEIRTISIQQPGGGRFEEEDTFLREYPVTLTYRGASAVLLRILDRLNAPEHPFPIQALRRFQADRQAREDDAMSMDLELVALRVSPAAPLSEDRR
jgi:hypothetical protein